MTITAAAHPDAGLEITIARDAAGCALVTISGELDLSTSPTLRSTLDRLIASGRKTITLDLTDLAFIDSVGLRSITTAAALAQNHGGDIILGGCSPIVHRFLALTARTRLHAPRQGTSLGLSRVWCSTRG